MWIDTHCHLDAAEFDTDRDQVRDQARALGVGLCVYPAVDLKTFDAVRVLAHRHTDVYALGIHPLYTPQARQTDLDQLAASLQTHRTDARLVAVGEIGLDGFVPGLDMARQVEIFRAQLELARAHDLPVILHVRRAVDAVLQHLRQVRVCGGIAHAFNGSLQQARALIDLGFGLGLGGALTYERATRLRQLARDVPLEAIVLETDAPDIPPQWLYTPAAGRADGQAQGRNSPAELPRIGALLAALRDMDPSTLAQRTAENTRRVLRLTATSPSPSV
jgi:TatD DNase family protein